MQIVFKHRLVCGMHTNGLENEIWYLSVYLPSIFLFNINFLNARFCNASSIFIVFSMHLLILLTHTISLKLIILNITFIR